MLHIVPESLPEPVAQEPYAEALARLAGIRHALRLVDPFAGGPASDPDEEEKISVALARAGRPRQRCFDNLTSATVSAAAAGLEALLAERSVGRTPHQAASHELTEEIRESLKQVSRLIFAA